MVLGSGEGQGSVSPGSGQAFLSDHPQCLTTQLVNADSSAVSRGFCPPREAGTLGWGFRNNFSEDLLLDKHRHSR